MKIKKAYIQHFKIPFKEPILGQDPYKEGFYFVCETDTGKKGIGELSTYRGLHPHDAKALKNEIEYVADQFLNQTLQFEKFCPHSPLFNLVVIQDIDPRLLFCVEGALLDLMVGSSLFHDSQPEIQALIIPGRPLPKKLSRINKIKIGKLHFNDEIDFLRNLPGQLRLDSNKSISAKMVRDYWEALGEKIDYFEDPFPFSSKWVELAKDGIPMALDENFVDYLDHDLTFLKALIIKPNLLPGIHNTFKLIDKLKTPLVVSSTFESKVGIRTLRRITQYKGFKYKTLHGLGTLHYLEDH